LLTTFFLIEQAVNAEESDAERPVKMLEGNLNLSKVQNSLSTENGSANVDSLLSENNPSNPTVGHETLSMGEILSSFDPGISVPTHSPEYSVERQTNKTNGSHPHVKRSNFWGRNNVSKKSSLPFFSVLLRSLIEFYFALVFLLSIALTSFIILIHMDDSCRQGRAKTLNQSIHLEKKSKLIAIEALTICD
jgi:hypothetical protein